MRRIRVQGTRLAAFARRLLARYSRGRAGRRASELPLVSARPMLVQLLLRTQIRTVGQAVRPVAAPPRAASAVTAAGRPGRATIGGAAAVDGPPVAATEGGGRPELFLRIIERSRRVEVERRGGPPRLGPAEPPRIPAERSTDAASLPLAVPAPARADAAAVASLADRSPPTTRAGRPSPSPTSAEAEPRVGPAPGTPRATVVPEHELQRLAERVIGTIDRRIAAQRERLGRP